MHEFSQSSEPIFLVVARFIANGILSGAYPAGSKVPSTTELSGFFKINPITAGRALNELAERGVLEKHRGIGTFVTADAVELLRRERIEGLSAAYVDPLIEEIRLLDIPIDDIVATIRQRDADMRSNKNPAAVINTAQPDNAQLSRPSYPSERD